MIERCPLDRRYGFLRCRNGSLFRACDVYGLSIPVGPCSWPGHLTGGISHCCEGDQACNDPNPLTDKPEGAEVSRETSSRERS